MFIKTKKKVIPCAIMGCYMTLKNCITAPEWQAIDLWPTLITLILATLYWGSRRVMKKKLSPIMLIVVSAFLGVAADGI